MDVGRGAASEGGGLPSAVVVPWVVYVAVLLVLSLLDRFGPRGLGYAIDFAINLVACVGLVLVAVRTVSRGAGSTGRRRAALVSSALAGGFLGPLVATIIVTKVSRDVDGGMWMLVSPALGVLCVGIAFVARLVWERKRVKSVE